MHQTFNCKRNIEVNNLPYRGRPMPREATHWANIRENLPQYTIHTRILSSQLLNGLLSTFNVVSPADGRNVSKVSVRATRELKNSIIRQNTKNDYGY